MTFDRKAYLAVAILIAFALFVLFAGGCAFQEVHGDCTVKIERTVTCKGNGHTNTAIGASP